MRKAFTVNIENKDRVVWDIEGKELDCGNGEPLTYWVYMGEDLPDGVAPNRDSEDLVHYHAGIQQLLWDIKITQNNTIKHKWDSINFRNHSKVEMWCNKKLVYEFTTTGSPSGFAYAMARVQYLQTQLLEHVYNFLDPKENEGRKIYWKGLPATIKVSSSMGWEIGIVPDYTCGLDKEQWWIELRNKEKFLCPTQSIIEDEESDKEDNDEDMDRDFINWGEALSDQFISWFR